MMLVEFCGMLGQFLAVVGILGLKWITRVAILVTLPEGARLFCVGSCCLESST